VVSFTAPIWLGPAYDGDFDRVRAAVRLDDPEELVDARRALASRDDDDDAHGALAVALAHAGQLPEAHLCLRDAYERWPRSGALRAAEARLLWEGGEDLQHACELVRQALELSTWTEDLLSLAVDLHRDCGEPEAAERILAVGLGRFPGAVSLNRRRRVDVSP
jgi:tetratricopeptide (TPR) repeat protein